VPTCFFCYIITKHNSDFKGKGFEIFAVSLDTKKNSWVDAIKQDGLTWIHGSDLKMMNSEVVRNMG